MRTPSYLLITLCCIFLLLAGGTLGWLAHGHQETATIQQLTDENIDLRMAFDRAKEGQESAESWLVELQQENAELEKDKESIKRTYEETLRTTRSMSADDAQGAIAARYDRQSDGSRQPTGVPARQSNPAGAIPQHTGRPTSGRP